MLLSEFRYHWPYALLFIHGTVCLTVLSCEAANPPDLPLVAAKAAAAVKRVIPRSEGEAQGPLAVVKNRTRRIRRQDTPARMDVPDAYGVMFIFGFNMDVIQARPFPEPAVRFSL
jgi:hypothetical protein